MKFNRLLCISILFFVVLDCESNDSVVEIGAGGLAFIEEKNISLNKEKLDISEDKISVQYEFENTSKKEIEATVGFPIPPFGIEYPSNTQTYPPNFGDFKVMANGIQVQYLTEVKAVTENGEDITNFFKEKKINYLKFGGFDIFPLADGIVNSPSDLPSYEIYNLSKEDREYLVSKKALSEDGVPLWSNKITYYWRQKFPADGITKISHSYTPYNGAFFAYEHNENSFDYLGNACIDPKLREKMSLYLDGNTVAKEFDRRVDVRTVSYILVTANSWKMPIKKFELTLRKKLPNPNEKKSVSFISLCWDGSIKKISDTEFKSEISDFMPTKDLLIYWYYLN